VAINALISENGDVLQVVVTESQATGYGLEKAAETAVRKWKFKPATKDGVNVRVWKPLLIVFKTPKK
jgi:TonB family protein